MRQCPRPTSSSSTTAAPTAPPISPRRWGSERRRGRVGPAASRRSPVSGRPTAPASPRASSLGYDALIEMDSDLQHDPAALPALISAVDSGADLAIGSRYVPGGAIPDWPKHREYLSQGRQPLRRLMLGLQVRDATAGFRCYSAADVVDGSISSRSRPTATASRSRWPTPWPSVGGRIVEVPIRFTDRVRGTSKMSSKIVFEALGLVTWWAIRDRVLHRGAGPRGGLSPFRHGRRRRSRPGRPRREPSLPGESGRYWSRDEGNARHRPAPETRPVAGRQPCRPRADDRRCRVALGPRRREAGPDRER